MGNIVDGHNKVFDQENSPAESCFIIHLFQGAGFRFEHYSIWGS
jgi:hypothetical protein